MSTSDEQAYYVIPLSVQQEGEDYLVGSVTLEEYYQFPEAGLTILRQLQAGLRPTEIKLALAQGAQEVVDVDDFVAMLVSIGFIYPHARAKQYQERLLEQRKPDGLVFKASPRLARAIFSPFGLAVYLLIIGWAAVAALRDASLRLNLHALFIENHLTLTLILLLLLYFVSVAMHELGHMLAASRYGISATLGIGNRLWNIVAEADLSGILSLPKRQRYLPLCAGMLVDVFNIAVITLLMMFLQRRGITGYTIPLLQALILQIVITISWQFNIFLRTDVYYVICTFFSYPDLDKDARLYLRALGHRLSGGRLGEPVQQALYGRRTGVLRAFTAIWVLGRVISLALLFTAILPALYRYGRQAYLAVRNPGVSAGASIDLALFALISAASLAIGIYMWLRRRSAAT